MCLLNLLIGELSFDIIWASATDGTTNSITLNCSEKPQLEQWIHVLRIAIPSDALSFSLEGDSSPTIVFSDASDLSWMEELGKVSLTCEACLMCSFMYYRKK